MNELIAKLYDQAIVIEDGGEYVTGELDPKRFAELIVRECISIMEHAHDNKMRLSDAIWNTRIGFDIE
jgi:hypothetical protein